MVLEKERSEVLKYCKLLQSRNLVKGTGGNISMINREKGLVAISPSAVEYSTMRVEDVAVINLDGNHIDGNYGASSERGMHLNCYRSREDIGGVVHTHSLYATVLACMGKRIPMFYYMQAYIGGATECIPYYPFGSKELAQAVEENLDGHNSLLLGNHGMLAVGTTLSQAFEVAEWTEVTAEIYTHVLKAGEPRLLTEEQVRETVESLKQYKSRAAR